MLAGYTPDLTPASQDDLDMGKIGGTGGTAFGLPMIWWIFKKATAGIGLDNVVIW